MNIIVSKLKDVLYSVLPIVFIVILLHFTIVPIDTVMLVRFLIGAASIVIGLTVFLIGIDIGVIPIGNRMGIAMVKSNSIWIVGIIGMLLGFFISIAEPAIHILAGRIDSISAGVIPKTNIVAVISFGIAIMLAVGLIRIVYNFPLHKLLTIVYSVVLLLSLFAPSEFIAIAFDSSGAITGALTVPFILALAIGVSRLKKDSKSSGADSFGLVAVAASGVLMSVMIMSIISKTGTIAGVLEEFQYSKSITGPFVKHFSAVLLESLAALAPILIVFLLFQKLTLHLPKSSVRKILFGLLFTLIGLVLFLLGVNAGFMEVGRMVGHKLAIKGNVYVVFIGFILGTVTTLAEPAVYVLTYQIEEVTSGYVKRRLVLIALASGVALAVTLSIIRILVPQIQLWHYLLPGYIISISLMYFVPKLFVGIAFDSGGVASGPMMAAFILSYTQGVAGTVEGSNVLISGFGVIAMVTMAPVIALQILGLMFKIKSRKKGVE